MDLFATLKNAVTQLTLLNIPRATHVLLIAYPYFAMRGLRCAKIEVDICDPPFCWLCYIEHKAQHSPA